MKYLLSAICTLCALTVMACTEEQTPTLPDFDPERSRVGPGGGLPAGGLPASSNPGGESADAGYDAVDPDADPDQIPDAG